MGSGCIWRPEQLLYFSPEELESSLTSGSELDTFEGLMILGLTETYHLLAMKGIESFWV
jgi:hypothetical protein